MDKQREEYLRKKYGDKYGGWRKHDPMDAYRKMVKQNTKTVLIPKGIHIFILEDSYERIWSLKKMIEGKATVTWVKDNVDAMKRFQQEKSKIGLLMIDHDLGHTKYSNDDTTVEFVQWLAQNHRGYRVPTIIHSLNPRGAMFLKYTLQQANFPKVYQTPFEYLDIVVEEK